MSVPSLALVGDELVIDGVAMFKATKALTPGRRMALVQDGFIEPSGHVRDASIEDENFEKGYDQGYAAGERENEAVVEQKISDALYNDRQRTRRGINEFVKAHKMGLWMTEALRLELLAAITNGLSEVEREDYELSQREADNG